MIDTIICYKGLMLTKDAEDDSVSSDPELQAGWLSLVRVVIKRGEVLQRSAVTELILVLQTQGYSIEEGHHILMPKTDCQSSLSKLDCYVFFESYHTCPL